MAKYSAEGTKSTNSVRGILVVNNTSAIRFKAYDYMVGCITTPADALFSQQIVRTSTDPTGTGVTLNPLDAADAAAAPAGFDAISADPTIGAVLVNFGLHHRASFRWVANPGSELVAPATDNNGISGVLRSASTADFEASMFVET